MKMKQFVVTGILAGSLFMGTSAMAEGQTTLPAETVTPGSETSPGVTPDSVFYHFDKLGERLQLLFTSKPEKEADLLLQFANERLAESDLMAEKEKEKYINKLMDDYLLILQKAQEKVGEVVTQDGTKDAVKDQLLTKLELITSVSENVENHVDKNTQTNLDEKRQEAYLVANVIKDLNPEKVKNLREQGFGFGEIVRVVSLAEISGKTEEEITTLLKEGKGFGDVAKELNVELKQITKKVINKKAKYIEKMIVAAEKSGNEQAVEQLMASLEIVKSKKVDFKIVKEYIEIEDEVKEKIAKIQEKVAAGKITQEAADRKMKKLQKEAMEELEELQEDADEDAEELAEKMEEKRKESKEEAREVAKKQEEKKQKEVEKQQKEQEKAEKEKQKELEKAEKEKQKELEKAQKEQEKAQKEKEKELEKQKKEQEKAEKEKVKENEKKQDEDEEDGDED